ncbi:MAG: aminotransferase class I/II-fold pyridoxal phosphate-dependent enzyme [Smithellaceae bacterium]|nr:aminotransferase class I/II-fold pyridoxal phosphate-dependent enzyme [Smithellaceae bacterium]
MTLFAERLNLISSENAFKIGPHIKALEADGKSIIKMNIGEPDFPLADHIKEEIKRQLDLNNTRYTDPQGILSLRQAIARRVGDSRGIPATPEQVVIFPGAKPSIGFAQQAYVNPGDEVIYPSPGFPIYESFIRYVGGVPKPLVLTEEKGFSFGGAELDRLITPRTKLIFLNFPSNPTGGLATREDLQEMAEVINARCGEDVRIFSDEIYETILFDGRTHESIASQKGMSSRTIVVSGHSKTYAWPGGRIGYAVFPTREEAEVFTNLNINYFSCVPPYNQEAARLALEDDRSEAGIRRMVGEFQKRRDMVVKLLNDIPGITCRLPAGAFYVFPNIAGVCENLGLLAAWEGLPAEQRAKTSPSTLFQMFLLYEHGAACMDRRSFGLAGSEGQHYLRLSIATSEAELREGMVRLARAARDKSGLTAFVAKGEHLFS